MSMPRYAQDAISQQGQGGFDFGGMGGGMGGGLGSGFAQFFSGLGHQSARPYAEGQREYDKYAGPWSQAGRGAINPFTNRINQMGDTNGFYNSIMNNYNESPMARFQQQQGMRAAQNMGSATGMTGSTPLMQQAQQNAQNISSQDMQRFFENQMGINKDYLSGQNQLMNYGYNSDQAAAPWMGEAAFGKEAGHQQDTANMIGGGAQIAGSLLQLLMGA